MLTEPFFHLVLRGQHIRRGVCFWFYLPFFHPGWLEGYEVLVIIVVLTIIINMLFNTNVLIMVKELSQYFPLILDCIKPMPFFNNPLLLPSSAPAPTPALAGGWVGYIFSWSSHPPTHPPTHPTTQPPGRVLSRPRMTLTSKAKLLVSMVRP